MATSRHMAADQRDQRDQISVTIYGAAFLRYAQMLRSKVGVYRVKLKLKIHPSLLRLEYLVK